MYPEAGGSSSFARRAFNEFWSFFAAWAQMLTYVITVAISAFFVPHYIGGLFWEPAALLAGGHRRRRLRDRRAGDHQRARGQGVHDAQRDARRHRLPDAGAARARRLRARPLAEHAGRQRPPRHRADLARLHPRDPDRDARLHRHRDDLEHGRGGQGRDEDDPDRDQPRADRGLHDLLHAAGRRALGAAGAARRRRRLLHAARADRGGGRLRRRPDPRRRQADRPRAAAERRGDLRRPARGDDPVPRHQRGADRRLAARLLDGHPPPAARPAAPAAPEVPDAVDRDPALLGDRDRARSCRARRASSATSTRSARCCRSRSRTPPSRGCGRRRRTSCGPTAARAT